jgi:hypothetical protein
MKLKKIKNKKAAFEMSISTIVILVIAMMMLVLGIILIQKIFGSATASVDNINDQTQNEINNLFGSENKDIIVKLGSQQTAKVKQGTQGFGFVFGIAPDNPQILSSCRYSITPGGGNCGTGITFPYGTSGVSFNKISDTAAFALVKLNVPDSQPICDQIYNIAVTCTGWQVQDFFSINVVKKGLF